MRSRLGGSHTRRAQQLQEKQSVVLVERPKQNVVGIKWAFHNKQDEHEVVTRNNRRLVAKGYSQVEGLDFKETFAPVARLESIHILLAYTTNHDFKLISNGCGKCILEWAYQRGSLFRETTGL
jgi:hypothetical protein